MKKLLLISDFNASLSAIWLLLLRALSSAFMLTHGYPKLTRLFGEGEIKFGDPIGIGPVPSLVLTVFAEVICAILIAVGAFTRLSCIPLIITMLVAAFIVHGSDPFARKEMALMYLLVYLTLFIFGAGKYSLDAWLLKKKL